MVFRALFEELGHISLSFVHTHTHTHTHTCVLSEPAYLARSVHPRQVSEVRVHRHTHNFTVDVVELIRLVTERDDLSRAYKSAAN